MRHIIKAILWALLLQMISSLTLLEMVQSETRTCISGYSMDYANNYVPGAHEQIIDLGESSNFTSQLEATIVQATQKLFYIQMTNTTSYQYKAWIFKDCGDSGEPSQTGNPSWQGNTGVPGAVGTFTNCDQNTGIIPIQISSLCSTNRIHKFCKSSTQSSHDIADLFTLTNSTISEYSCVSNNTSILTISGSGDQYIIDISNSLTDYVKITCTHQTNATASAERTVEVKVGGTLTQKPDTDAGIDEQLAKNTGNFSEFINSVEDVNEQDFTFALSSSNTSVVAISQFKDDISQHKAILEDDLINFSENSSIKFYVIATSCTNDNQDILASNEYTLDINVNSENLPSYIFCQNPSKNEDFGSSDIFFGFNTTDCAISPSNLAAYSINSTGTINLLRNSVSTYEPYITCKQENDQWTQRQIQFEVKEFEHYTNSTLSLSNTIEYSLTYVMNLENATTNPYFDLSSYIESVIESNGCDIEFKISDNSLDVQHPAWFIEDNLGQNRATLSDGFSQNSTSYEIYIIATSISGSNETNLTSSKFTLQVDGNDLEAIPVDDYTFCLKIDPEIEFGTFGSTTEFFQNPNDPTGENIGNCEINPLDSSYSIDPAKGFITITDPTISQNHTATVTCTDLENQFTRSNENIFFQILYPEITPNLNSSILESYDPDSHNYEPGQSIQFIKKDAYNNHANFQFEVTFANFTNTNETLCPITRYQISKSNSTMDPYIDDQGFNILEEPIVTDQGYLIKFPTRYAKNHTFFVHASIGDGRFWWSSEEITIAIVEDFYKEEEEELYVHLIQVPPQFTNPGSETVELSFDQTVREQIYEIPSFQDTNGTISVSFSNLPSFAVFDEANQTISFQNLTQDSTGDYNVTMVIANEEGLENSKNIVFKISVYDENQDGQDQHMEAEGEGFLGVIVEEEEEEETVVDAWEPPPEEKEEPLKVQILDISSSGTIFVGFSKDVEVPPEIEQYFKDQERRRQLQGTSDASDQNLDNDDALPDDFLSKYLENIMECQLYKYDELSKTHKPYSSSEFNFFLEKWNKKGMEVKLDFDKPLQVSHSSVPDIAELIIKDPSFFNSDDGTEKFDPSQDNQEGLKFELPKQLIGQSEESLVQAVVVVSSTATGITLIPYIIQVLMKASKQKIILLFLALQFVQVLEIYSSFMPAQVVVVLKEINSIVNLKLMHPQSLYIFFTSLYYKCTSMKNYPFSEIQWQQKQQNHTLMDFLKRFDKTSTMIVLATSQFILASPFLLCKRSRSFMVKEWNQTKKTLFWNGFLQLFELEYLVYCYMLTERIKNLMIGQLDENDNESNFGMNIFMTIFLSLTIILIPSIVTFKLYKTSNEDLMEQESIDSIGILTRNLNLKNKSLRVKLHYPLSLVVKGLALFIPLMIPELPVLQLILVNVTIIGYYLNILNTKTFQARKNEIILRNMVQYSVSLCFIFPMIFVRRYIPDDTDPKDTENGEESTLIVFQGFLDNEDIWYQQGQVQNILFCIVLFWSMLLIIFTTIQETSIKKFRYNCFTSLPICCQNKISRKKIKYPWKRFSPSRVSEIDQRRFWYLQYLERFFDQDTDFNKAVMEDKVSKWDVNDRRLRAIRNEQFRLVLKGYKYTKSDEEIEAWEKDIEALLKEQNDLHDQGQGEMNEKYQQKFRNDFLSLTVHQIMNLIDEENDEMLGKLAKRKKMIRDKKKCKPVSSIINDLEQIDDFVPSPRIKKIKLISVKTQKTLDKILRVKGQKMRTNLSQVNEDRQGEDLNTIVEEAPKLLETTEYKGIELIQLSSAKKNHQQNTQPEKFQSYSQIKQLTSVKVGGQIISSYQGSQRSSLQHEEFKISTEPTPSFQKPQWTESQQILESRGIPSLYDQITGIQSVPENHQIPIKRNDSSFMSNYAMHKQRAIMGGNFQQNIELNRLRNKFANQR